MIPHEKVGALPMHRLFRCLPALGEVAKSNSLGGEVYILWRFATVSGKRFGRVSKAYKQETYDNAIARPFSLGIGGPQLLPELRNTRAQMQDTWRSPCAALQLGQRSFEQSLT